MKDSVKPGWVLAGTAVVFVVLVVIAADPDWDGISWGDAPTWFAGVVAVVAVFFASKAASQAIGILRLEQARENRALQAERERQAAAERAEQADRVAAWNNGDFTVLNGSDLPIWDVELTAHDPEVPLATMRENVRLVPPGHHQYAFPNYEPEIVGTDERGLPVHDDSWTRLQVDIRFRDAAGRVWMRDRFGTLQLVGRAAFITPEGITATASLSLDARIASADDSAST